MGTPTPLGTPAVLPNAHSALITNNRDEQDWVAFMSQPYWVEVKVEVEFE